MMLLSWYEQLAATMAQISARRLYPTIPRHRRRYRPRLDPLEARLVLYDHTFSHGSCSLVCNNLWSDESNWSNGSPAGDPDPAGAVVIFPEDAGSSWDLNIDDIPGELPVKSLFYHRGGFVSGPANVNGNSLLLSQDIYTDLAGPNTVDIPIRFTSDANNFEHQIQVNNGGELDLEPGIPGLLDLTGGIAALIDKTGTGTLALYGNDQNYLGLIALRQGMLQLHNANALANATPITAFDTGTVLGLNNFDLTASMRTNVLGFIQLGSATLSFSGGSMSEIDGMVSGSGGLSVVDPSAQITLGARGTFNYTGATDIRAGLFQVDGTLTTSPITVEGSGILAGAGTVGSVLFDSGSSFQANINRTGTNQYARLTVNGMIDLSNSPALIVNNAVNAAEGESFSILHSNTGISGTFANLPDGSTLSVNHKTFRVNYPANDVMLTLLPQFVTPPTYYPDGDSGGPHGLALGDFNGDGIPDLVAVNGSPSASLTMLLGNGDGTFQSASPIAIPGQPLAVTVGDFNNDGILDLAVAGGINNGTVDVLLGNGDGTFQAPVAYAVGAYPTDIEVADVNGDGNQDLVVLNQNGNSISILYGNGDGTFQSAPPMTFPGYVTTAFAILPDLNSGRVDLVVGNETGVYGGGSVISVQLNLGNDANGQAIFQDAMDYPTHSYINALAVADFNGDGIPDVLWSAQGVAGPGGVGVYLGTRDGLFQSTPIVSTTGANGSAVAVRDFDGDGTLDIAIPAGGGAGSPGLIVLYGHGDGSFGPPSIYAVNGGYDPPVGVLAGDFNGDGAPDLAVLTEYFGLTPGHVAILLNMGFGNGPAPQRYGQSARRGLHGASSANAGFLDPVGSDNSATAATVASTSPTGPLPPSAATVLPMDQLFAIVGADDLGSAVDHRRLLAVPALDPLFAWEMTRDGWLADGIFPEELAGCERAS
jgi:hypothetical protein